MSAEPTPDTVPDTMEALDYAHFQMFLARVDAARAKLSLLHAIQRDMQEAEQAVAQIAQKYLLRQEDQVQPDGAIIRSSPRRTPT